MTNAVSVFRFDIHALRAWAVVVVVGYHLGIPGFASGFAGVDIFFVISGYLITAQALVQLDAGRFSFIHFWTARLRRIGPVLLVVLAVSALLGWWLTMPGEYLRHIRQALFAATFSSNIPFGDQQGYFDPVAHSKPLLHTWSLSIEWQFYMLLPLVLVLVWRFTPAIHRRAAVLWVLLLLLMASMLYCIWLGRVQASDAFFSLRARAWEMLLGAVMAAAPITQTSAPETFNSFAVRAFKRYGGWLGWAAVAAAAVVTLPVRQWPGVWTLLPVVGASLIVGCSPVVNTSRLTQAVLGNAWVQSVGDWSYSIYLWHWPLWVFMLAWLDAKGQALLPVHIGALIALLSALGFLSYRYIEQPTRKHTEFWTTSRLWLASLVAVAVIFLFTLAAIKTHGFDSRVPDYLQRAELAKRLNTPRDECFRNAKSEKRAAQQFCNFGSPVGSEVATAMLWGDSVAGQFLVPISSAASAVGVHGQIATQSGCRALLVEQLPTDSSFDGCARFNREVNAALQRQVEPRIVIIGRNWSNSQTSVDEAFVLVKHLLDTGRTVVLILPMLNLDFDVPQRWIREQRLADLAIDNMTTPETPNLTFKTARDAIAGQIRQLDGNPRLITIDLLPHICNAGVCSLVRDGQANFRDTLHISNTKAEQYEPFFTAALLQAVRVQGSGEVTSNKSIARP